MADIKDNKNAEGEYSLDDTEFEKEDLGEVLEAEVDQKPFDPKKVDISITTPNLGALIDRLEHSEIDLMPDFQRSGDLWSRQMQSRLIESVLIRLPVPAFYFDALAEDKWQVVDGLQRLSAIKNFAVDKTLALVNLEFLGEYNGFYYDQLPRSYKRRIDEFQTTVYLIKPGTPLPMKYALFNRINTGGLKLTHQEIRHAMSQSVNKGRASKFLSDIVRQDEFKSVVGSTSKRMAYQELVLRHMSFVVFGPDNYRSSLPKFLDLGMTVLAEASDSDLDDLRRNFLSAMSAASELFGRHAFKKTLVEPGHKKVVNKPLFEALSVCLASISSEDRGVLIRRRDDFIERFSALLINDEFNLSISRSTANKDNVEMRFEMVGDVISQCLSEEVI